MKRPQKHAPRHGCPALAVVAAAAACLLVGAGTLGGVPLSEVLLVADDGGVTSSWSAAIDSTGTDAYDFLLDAPSPPPVPGTATTIESTAAGLAPGITLVLDTRDGDGGREVWGNAGFELLELVPTGAHPGPYPVVLTWDLSAANGWLYTLIDFGPDLTRDTADDQVVNLQVTPALTVPDVSPANGRLLELRTYAKPPPRITNLDVRASPVPGFANAQLEWNSVPGTYARFSIEVSAGGGGGGAWVTVVTVPASGSGSDMWNGAIPVPAPVTRVRVVGRNP